MFSYNSAVKPKNMNKVPAQLIQHFKNTVQIPKKSFKENQNPRELINLHPDVKVNKIEPAPEKSKITKSKIVEGDISKIADSYVLEGDLLKKNQAYEEAIRKDKKKALKNDKQNSQTPKILDRKQILKLEYLQKMGFLRPDQKLILAQYRKSHGQQSFSETGKKASGVPTTKGYQNIPQQMVGNGQFYSPKNFEPKKLPTNYLYSPNRLFFPPHSHMPGY